MNQAIRPDSVVKQVRVKADPALAFKVFVERIGAWWPRDHRIGAAPIADIVIEPREGGRLFERWTDGTECACGRVLAFEPGERLLLGWQLNADWQYDADFLVEVEVKFAADGDGTLVRLEHRNLERYGQKATDVATSIGGENGWPAILQNYCTCCEAC